VRPGDGESLADRDSAGRIQVLPGLRALLVGASGGIGLETARWLDPAEGWLGLHCHTNRSALDELCARAGLRSKARVFQADLSRPAHCHDLVQEFVAWSGGIDVLVVLLGAVHSPAGWDELTPDAWQHDLDLNLTAPFHLAQEAMVTMQRAEKGGRIIFAGSISAAYGGGPSTLAYGVAKAGIEGLVKGLARAGAPHHILVNAVVPGFVDTGFHARWIGRTPEEVRERVTRVPLGRPGTPAEVAAAITYLCSPWAGFITGALLPVSGGD